MATKAEQARRWARRVEAAQRAIEAHADAMRLDWKDGEPTKLYHLLASLDALCAARGYGLDAILAEVRRDAC